MCPMQLLQIKQLPQKWIVWKKIEEKKSKHGMKGKRKGGLSSVTSEDILQGIILIQVQAYCNPYLAPP